MELEYFWDSSYANIILKLQAFAELKDIERKRDAVNNYTLAQLLGANVGAMFSKDGKVPPIEKCFPHLFSEEDLTTRTKEEVVPEGSLSAAEANFLSGMIALQNRLNRQNKENKKE